MKLATNTCKQHTAFTLIELLVVISIIALLAAILFPVFARARETARRSSCSSNQKQIGIGVLQYTQDYDERTPIAPRYVDNYSMTTETNWIAAIHPYVKSWQIFRCPSVPAAIWAGAPPVGNSNSSYFFNGVVANRSLSVIPDAAGIIMGHEFHSATRWAYGYPFLDTGGWMNWLADGSQNTWGSTVGQGYNETHFGGANMLFCDGHVKWRNANSVRSAEYGLGGGYVGPQDPSVMAPALF